jgi:hypothetical protein
MAWTLRGDADCGRGAVDAILNFIICGREGNWPISRWVREGAALTLSCGRHSRPSATRPQDAILPHDALRASSQQSALSGGVGKFSRISDPNPTPSLAKARVRLRLCNSCGMSVRLQSRARKKAGSVILQFPQRAGCTKSSRRAKNMKDSNTKSPLASRMR